MKVLQVGKFYPIRGGVEKVMYDLMLGLSGRGIRCDMLCAATENHPAAQIKINEYADLIVVKTKIKLAATMIAPQMIIKLRKIASDYNIIHIHHPDPMATLALFLSGYKGKVILHWHSDILKQKVLLKLYAPLQRWLISRADYVVGTTPVYVKESPFLQNVQHKIDFIPIGIEALKVDEKRVELMRNKYAAKKIVYSLGRLVEYKGFAHLIRAAQHLHEDIVVLIGGMGPLESELSSMILELNLYDKVKLLGFVSDEDISTYFAACDVFCLSSIMKTEAFAIVQLEAMSCSKPIVSAHIPQSGVTWVNADGQSGLVVEKENELALANALNKILTDASLYTDLAKGAQQRFLENFTRDNMIDRTVMIYEKIIK